MKLDRYFTKGNTLPVFLCSIVLVTDISALRKGSYQRRMTNDVC